MHSRRGHSIANAVHFGKDYREYGIGPSIYWKEKLTNIICDGKKQILIINA